MQEFLRWLASWKGITVEDGADLHFEFTRFPTGGLGLMVLLGCLLAVLFVTFIYRRDGKNLQGWQRLVLGTLRLLAVLAAIALLLEPNLVAVKRETRAGHTLLLVDTSQSMTHLDAYRRDHVQPLAAGWRELGITDPAAAPRIDLAKAVLGARDGELIRKIAAKNEAQLYTFSGSIDQLPLLPEPERLGPDGKPMPAGTDGAPKPPPRVDLARLTADGRFSNLGSSLRAALDRSRNAEIAAVVILSDGRRNAGPLGAEIARMLNQRKVPHTFVLGIGDPAETQAVGITRLEAPEKVFQKDPFELKANISATGYDQTAVTVRLLRIDDKGAQSVVRTQQVQVGGEKTDTIAEFKEVTSDETGKFTYRVELQPPSGEPPAPERHQKNAAIEVLGERTRVLLLAGGSSHEFQILRQLLIRDKTIDVSCWLQSADAEFPQDGDPDVTIKNLPETPAALDPYDVAILIDPNADKLTASFSEMLAKHVVENGCGLWWVCGEKYTLEALRSPNTKAIAALLPVVYDLEKADTTIIGFGLAFNRPWPYQLSAEGEDGLASKIARIAENKDEARLLWNRLPGFHFSFPAKRPKPAATVLVEHTAPQLKVEGRGMPLVATHFLGAGRVIANGMDESYRWRSLYEDAYNRFWIKGIRYLLEGRIHAGNSRVRVAVSDEKVELGEALRLTIEAKDEALQPLMAEYLDLALEKDGQPQETLKLLPNEESTGTFELMFRPTQTGTYRVRTLQKAGKEAEAAFQVIPAQIEREGPMDRAELAAVAGATGGELCDTPAQLLAALDKVPSRSATDTFRTPHAVWDSWVTVGFILFVLAIEWLLRKRFNLL
ncbi:MAG: hypothetical protein IPK26_18825 [Planctomycetes bacterium]|nr:hypothetical protein [Planctomycetota bacterium]